MLYLITILIPPDLQSRRTESLVECLKVLRISAIRYYKEKDI